MKKITSMIILFLTSVISIDGQNDPCSSPSSSQFDFWIGNWKCSWEDTDGSIKTGSNTVKKILNNCVIEENFDGSPGSELIGRSFSVYSPFFNKWKQTWVDNNGSYLDFEGGLEGDKMILSRTVNKKDGTSFMQRMVWYNITKDKFDWNWERSDDGGKTWKVNWQILYERKE